MSARTTTAAAQSSKPPRFFSLECRYTIEPGATLPGLVNDGYTLLSSAIGVLEGLVLSQDAEFAVLHLLRQANAVIGEAAELAEKQAPGAAPSAEAEPAGASINAATMQQARGVPPAPPQPGAAELERLASFTPRALVELLLPKAAPQLSRADLLAIVVGGASFAAHAAGHAAEVAEGVGCLVAEDAAAACTGRFQTAASVAALLGHLQTHFHALEGVSSAVSWAASELSARGAK